MPPVRTKGWMIANGAKVKDSIKDYETSSCHAGRTDSRHCIFSSILIIMQAFSPKRPIGTAAADRDRDDECKNPP